MSRSYKKYPGFQTPIFKEPKKVANRKFRRTTKDDYNMPNGNFYRHYFDNDEMYDLWQSGYTTYEQFRGSDVDLEKFWDGDEEKCYLAWESIYLRK